VAKFIIWARHLHEQELKKTALEEPQYLPDLLAFHIERGARFEEVAVRKFLKHGVIVFRVVASDVPNLENR
jgi:hypothetical protein